MLLNDVHRELLSALRLKQEIVVTPILPYLCYTLRETS